MPHLARLLAGFCILECIMNIVALLPMSRPRRLSARLTYRLPDDSDGATPCQPDFARRSFIAAMPLYALMFLRPSDYGATALGASSPAVSSGTSSADPLVWSPLGSGRTLTRNSKVTRTRGPSRYKVRFITYLTRYVMVVSKKASLAQQI
jgi:hypothetical protein